MTRRGFVWSIRGRARRDAFFETLPGLPAGVSEIFAHPVLDSEELRGYDLNNAAIRIHDTACLIGPAVRELSNTASARSAIGRCGSYGGSAEDDAASPASQIRTLPRTR